ncbi:DUF6233 domain-containing protein [Streptomyces lavendulocolor]|uniref:DUF6233 domain-containing protein n=1 Tax=Streptomyces lavendulocolor TaxID=67316 RepID=UPI003C309942
MSDPLPPPYPPDDERLADIETYLTVQLMYVRQARAAEARRRETQRRTAPPPPPPYRLQRGLDAARTVVRVHLGDCAMAKKGPGVDDLTARRALVEGVEACAVCRPDTELGLIDG